MIQIYNIFDNIQRVSLLDLTLLYEGHDEIC